VDFFTSQAEVELEYDHLVIFVQDESLKDSLDLYLTAAEKLSTTHPEQGTRGEYYLFYNSYLELLYLEDSTKAIANQSRFGSDYLKRWNPELSVPLAIGMSLPNWEEDHSSPLFHKYSSDESSDDFYLMSVHNQDHSQPMVYVSRPEREYETIDKIEDIEEKPAEIREDLRNYLSHPSGIKQLSWISYSPNKYKSISGNLNLMGKSEMIRFKKSVDSEIRLVFDEGLKGEKQFKINRHWRLTISF
jgi:hypothetical protein